MNISFSLLFKQILFVIYVYYFKLMTLMGYKEKKSKSIISTENEFFNGKKTLFFEKVEKHGKTLYNQNVDPIFYNKEAYNEYLSDAEPTLMEKKWKSRQIMIYTPRGNIIMHYDAYKMSFSYYCDQSKISNSILNACAMEYVMRYRCLDFYVDEISSPNFNENEIVKIHYLNMSIKENKPIKKASMIATAALKKNDIMNAKNRPTLKNKFVHLGKISNMALLPPKKCENQINGFFSKLLDELEDMDSESEKEKEKPLSKTKKDEKLLTYAEYKKMMSEKEKSE